jgi:hypothetical protein
MRAQTTVGLALIAAIQGGCSKWRSDGPGQPEGEPWCGPNECSNVDDGVEEGVLGGLVRIRSFGSPCVLTVAWPFWQRAVYGFQAKLVAQKGDMFPSRYGLVELLDCDGVDPRRRPGNELPILHYAIVFHGQHDLPEGIALSPGELFIPLKGEAALDSGWLATAQLVGSGGQGGAPYATITVVHRSDPAVVHPTLRVGDSFPWGDRVARLARIVEPRPPHVIGWIAVEVSAPPGDVE